MSHYVRFAPLSWSDHLTLESTSNHSCPHGVQWIWSLMGDCAVSTREQVSAYVGLLSMVTWMMVGIPQIIKNFRNIDGMSGVSFLLLFQWTAGDTTNLVGAILTNQLKPQIYLAVFFVISDSVLLVQYLYYYIRKVRRTNENGRAINAASRAILCVMGLASFTHCFTGLLLPSSSTFDAESRNQMAPSGHMSRFLLSEESQSSLTFRSEGHPSSGVFEDLASSQHASPAFWNNTKDIVGYVIGCVSSVFYLGSRTSQILKNYRARSTEGLAVLTFILAVFGNLTYGGQILIQDLHKEFLLEHTPWLIGSLGVIGLDCTLLWQFHHYSHMDRRRDETRQSLINHEDCAVNSDASDQHVAGPHSDKEFVDSLY